MSYANPTRLRIGMHGEFEGQDYRLVGRVVMGVEVDGETYYWNEFNLEARDGRTADLVYEETERGGEWRMFTLFEPEYPMTAADAATKRVGDHLNLTDTEVRVTLRDQSRVYRIEGQAPEGVEVGDVANYFNAEARGIMQVVSWTGDEVEYYNGVQLSPLVVESAFKLPKLTQPNLLSGFKGGDDSGSSSTDSAGGFQFVLKAVAVLVVFFLIFGRNLSCPTTRLAAPVKSIAAPKPPLMTGATGIMDGNHLRITAHAVVEIAETGRIYERHEYTLDDGSNAPSLLVCGNAPGAGDWILFTPIAPLLPPTPQQAAAQKTGDIVNVDGIIATISGLFQSTIHGVDNVVPTDWHYGDVSYGYFGRSEYFSLLARWNSSGIWFYRGKTVSPKAITAAFSESTGK